MRIIPVIVGAIIAVSLANDLWLRSRGIIVVIVGAIIAVVIAISKALLDAANKHSKGD